MSSTSRVTTTRSINDTKHPNHAGFLMARDMLVSLLISDGDMAKLANNWDAALYASYQEKATWMIRQMLMRRLQLDDTSDFNRNGDPTDDESHGEIFQAGTRTGNNDSNTLEEAPPGVALEDGSGRLGDSQNLWGGTWPVYQNPKDMLTQFEADPNPPISNQDFETLNQRVTMYSMDTEHMADPDHPHVGAAGIGRELRYNINRMAPKDDPETAARTNRRSTNTWFP